MNRSPLVQSERFAGLIDIYQPEAVSWFPQTIGWLIVLILVLVLLSFFGYRKLLLYWQNRYRREALAALEKVGLNNSAEQIAFDLFFIMKTVATYQDRQAGPLTGEQFLVHLDQQLTKQDAVFRSDIGDKWVKGLVSTDCELSQSEVETLVTLCRDWINNHKQRGKNHA